MNRLVLSISPGLPSGSVVKNPPASQEPHPEDVVQSLGQEDPLEEGNSLWQKVRLVISNDLTSGRGTTLDHSRAFV